MHLPFFFGAATGSTVDPIIGLITSLGPSAAAVTVVWLFLQSQKAESADRAREAAERDQRWASLADDYKDVIRENTEAWRELTRSLPSMCHAAPERNARS